MAPELVQQHTPQRKSSERHARIFRVIAQDCAQKLDRAAGLTQRARGIDLAQELLRVARRRTRYTSGPPRGVVDIVCRARSCRGLGLSVHDERGEPAALTGQKLLLAEPPVDFDRALFHRDADTIGDHLHAERRAHHAHRHVARPHRERALGPACHFEPRPPVLEPHVEERTRASSAMEDEYFLAGLAARDCTARRR